MAGSRSRTRQNACKTCTKAKRACDRQVPQCGRCAARMLDCQYFTRPRRNENTILVPRPPTYDVLQLYQPRPIIGAEQTRQSILDSPLAALLQENVTAASQLPVAPDALHHDNNIENQIVTSTVSRQYAEPEFSWFLAQSSWDIKHGLIAVPIPSTPPPSCIFKKFVKTVQGWLRDWATHGHNIFIHRELYQPGLPGCLEDTFTTLHAYLARTEDTEDIVLRIIENRATSLCQQAILLEGVEILDTKAHIARTQALLVYTLIRLFDGCPRQRAQAEGTFYTLFQWCEQMRDAAVAEAPQLYDKLRLLQPGEDQVELAVWKAWILSESLRRTWLLVSATVNAYQTIKDGRGTCTGFLMFTTRKGLWEAPNAWQWAQLLQKKSPLFTQSINLPELMEEMPPGEIDTFTNQMLSTVLSSEQLDRWAAKTTQAAG